jgi:hypothetical protein
MFMGPRQPSPNEARLVSLAAALGAEAVPVLSGAETALLRQVSPQIEFAVGELRKQIRNGNDPLGETFSRLRSASERRPLGATYTPGTIVRLMIDWASSQGEPTRVVDPGVGSARFLVEAGRRFPKAQLVGIEVDPVAALLARAHLAVAGFANRAEVILGDYRSVVLDPITGKTLFVGNPPYVRHHQISADWKHWLTSHAKAMDLSASQLSGLHVHFFLATALHAKPGDSGAFITAAEWLDVNYGRLVRELFVGPLGGRDLVVLEPTAEPFPDAATTAAITTFEVGTKRRSILVQRVESIEALGQIGNGRPVHRDRFTPGSRWSHLTRAARQVPSDFVELGEICRVHRGSVTVANKVWIAGQHSTGLPSSILFPSVTRAKELFEADGVLEDTRHLRTVIDIPPDLDVFNGEDRKAIDRFLKTARTRGADQSYVARHRKAWWSVGLRKPPPLMATYMARRPPAFVRNRAQARYINIAHGLYPREPLPESTLVNLAAFLARSTCTTQGRTYSGGLTKFEPREMERILVPRPEALANGWYL